MLLKAAAAAIAAIFLLAANSYHCEASPTEIDPQRAAAAFVSIGHAVATGGSADKGCRALGLDELECGELVRIADLTRVALGGRLKYKSRRQGLVKSTPVASSEAMLQLAAMLPPGEEAIELGQMYTMTMRRAVCKGLRRNGKRLRQLVKRGWFSWGSRADEPVADGSVNDIEMQGHRSHRPNSGMQQCLPEDESPRAEQVAAVSALFDAAAEMAENPNRQCELDSGNPRGASDGYSRPMQNSMSRQQPDSPPQSREGAVSSWRKCPSCPSPSLPECLRPGALYSTCKYPYRAYLPFALVAGFVTVLVGLTRDMGSPEQIIMIVLGNAVVASDLLALWVRGRCKRCAD